jgi:hypothetical protein
MTFSAMRVIISIEVVLPSLVAEEETTSIERILF